MSASRIGSRIGVMFDRDRQPEELPEFARTVEELGADDLWVVEDLGWAGSVASATAALSVTERLRVGIGIAPAPLRNPALLAMELAMIARIHPGRLVAGIGHGVEGWMEQVGAGTPHKLALLEETIASVRALVRGEKVTLEGKVVRIDGVRLVHPAPDAPPPVVAGVVRPRSLELSGRVADGTVISEAHGPSGVASARAHIDRGRAASGEPERPHQINVFTHLCVSDDPEAVRTATAPIVDEYTAWLGIPPADVFLCAGPPAEAASRVASLWEAGADTVVLRPVGDDPAGQVRKVLAELGR